MKIRGPLIIAALAICMQMLQVGAMGDQSEAIEQEFRASYPNIEIWNSVLVALSKGELIWSSIYTNQADGSIWFFSAVYSKARNQVFFCDYPCSFLKSRGKSRPSSMAEVSAIDEGGKELKCLSGDKLSSWLEVIEGKVDNIISYQTTYHEGQGYIIPGNAKGLVIKFRGIERFGVDAFRIKKIFN